MSTASSPFAAVLFDMDGVLIESKQGIENAWRKAALLHGRQISDEEMNELVHGRPGSFTVDALFPHLTAPQKQEVRRLVDSIQESDPCESIVGVEAFIQELIAHGITFGLVTSGWPTRIEFVLQNLGLAGKFSVIVSRDDVRQGKPNPEPYLTAAARLGLPASRTIVYEDSASGVQAAAKAGAYCVGIGGEELLDVGARTAIRDFSGISLQRTSPGEVSMIFSSGHKMLVECARRD
ncbi:MAG: HAD family phosphatase [Cystobacter sp.]